jgi:hypothetical protein
MPETLGAVYVIVLLLPGFVGYLALAKVYNRTIDDAFDKVALVVLITALSLALIAVVHDVAIPANNAAITGRAVRDFVTITFPAQTLICLGLGAMLGAIANLDVFARLAQRWRISAKTGQAAVIAATIRQHPDAYFRLRWKDGGYVVGHPILYSLDGEETALLLEKAAYRRKRASARAPQPPEIPVAGPGVLVVRFDDIQFIEIL